VANPNPYAPTVAAFLLLAGAELFSLTGFNVRHPAPHDLPSLLPVAQPPVVPGPCEYDTDCVRATCCHPTQCTSADRAPSCGEEMCTASVVFASLDVGRCRCIEGACAAVIPRWDGGGLPPPGWPVR
jgi:hypothetical protein